MRTLRACWPVPRPVGAWGRLVAPPEVKAGDLVIMHLWSRATPGGAKIAAAISRSRTRPRRRTADAASGDSAGKVEIHEIAMDNGVMTMRPLEGVGDRARQDREAAPGGYHLMLMELKNPLSRARRCRSNCNPEAGKVACRSTFRVSARRPRAAE